MSNKKIYSDKELIERIRQSDKVAFRTLFNQYYKELVGTAVNILKNEDKGKDAVQEVFLQVWKNRANLEIRSSLRSYLKRGVINRSLNQINYAKNFVAEDKLLEHSSSNISALDELALQDLETALQAALDQLPERCRLVFVMKRLEGMSHKEISETLGISPKTIENQITKAMKALKEGLQAFRKKK